MSGFLEGELLENTKRRKQYELRNWEANVKPRTWMNSVIFGDDADTNRVNKTESIIAFARAIWRRFGLVVVIKSITLVDKVILFCELVVALAVLVSNCRLI